MKTMEEVADSQGLQHKRWRQASVASRALTVSDHHHRSSVEPPGNDALGISFSARTYVLVL